MSRKHFEALARTFNENMPVPGFKGYEQAYEQWSEDLKRVAMTISQLSPKCNRLRFLKAAGLDVDAALAKPAWVKQGVWDRM